MTHEQRSDGWFQARLGKATASRMGDLSARTKSGYSASRANYMAELVLERLLGKPTEKFETAAMRNGTELEQEARAAYELETEQFVIETGFLDHPTIPMSGGSPDGLVAADGLIEIKCMQPAGHLDLLLGGSVAGAHEKQMQFLLAVTGRQWADYVAYNPSFPANLQLHVRRFLRDETMIADIEAEVVKFLAELDEKVTKLEKVQRVAA